MLSRLVWWQSSSSVISDFFSVVESYGATYASWGLNVGCFNEILRRNKGDKFTLPEMDLEFLSCLDARTPPTVLSVVLLDISCSI